MPRLACGPFLLAALIAGCGKGTAPSAEDNRQLDNASQMLDQAPDLLANIDDNALGPADGNEVNRGQ